jgi:hypothetical protein
MTMQASLTNTRYTVRHVGRTARVEKWDAGGGRTCYVIDDEGCSCPDATMRRRICKHQRLLNLLATGRLRPGAVYRFDGDGWDEVRRPGMQPRPPQMKPALSRAQGS